MTQVGRGIHKIIKTESLNLAVTLCNRLNDTKPDTLTGGFGIAASPVPSPMASGWGTIDGVKRGSKVTLKLEGSTTD